MSDEPPYEQTDREAASDAALKRIMPDLLPHLRKVFDAIREQGLDDPETPVKTWAPVAATYRLWHDASIKALTEHYHQFEQPLTIAERQDASPHAAKDYAEDLTGLNEQEAIATYIAEQRPPLELPQMRAMHDAFAEVKRRAQQIDTQGVVAFRRPLKPDGSPGRA